MEIVHIVKISIIRAYYSGFSIFLDNRVTRINNVTVTQFPRKWVKKLKKNGRPQFICAPLTFVLCVTTLVSNEDFIVHRRIYARIYLYSNVYRRIEKRSGTYR